MSTPNNGCRECREVKWHKIGCFFDVSKGSDIGTSPVLDSERTPPQERIPQRHQFVPHWNPEITWCNAHVVETGDEYFACGQPRNAEVHLKLLERMRGHRAGCFCKGKDRDPSCNPNAPEIHGVEVYCDAEYSLRGCGLPTGHTAPHQFNRDIGKYPVGAATAQPAPPGDPTRFLNRSFTFLENKTHSVRLIDRESKGAISISWDDLPALRELITLTLEDGPMTVGPQPPTYCANCAEPVRSDAAELKAIERIHVCPKCQGACLCKSAPLLKGEK